MPIVWFDLELFQRWRMQMSTKMERPFGILNISLTSYSASPTPSEGKKTYSNLILHLEREIDVFPLSFQFV